MLTYNANSNCLGVFVCSLAASHNGCPAHLRCALFQKGTSFHAADIVVVSETEGADGFNGWFACWCRRYKLQILF